MNKKHLSLLLLMLVVVLAFVAYWGGLSNLFDRWSNEEQYGHAYFLPVITAWFLWSRKEALVGSVGQASFLGPMILVLGTLGLLLGEVTAIFILIQLGFILTLIGAVIAYGGLSLIRVSILPILILIFAIPVPFFIEAQLSWRLQIMSSEIGVALLRLMNYSVFLEGNVIDLGSYKLQVVEACSGLRYLYPLMSIGFLMAYMYKGKLWQKAILFLSTIPITVLMNSVRIAMVGVLVNQWGSEQAEGFVHYFEGWVIFMACLFILVGGIVLFEKFGQKRTFNQAVDVPEIQPQMPSSRKMNIVPQYINIGLLILATVFVNNVANREEIKPERKAFLGFPTELNGWKATLSNLEPNVIKTLQLKDYFLGDYQHDDEGAVNFYVAYYDSQRKGASPHSPSVCIPGGGWVISSLDQINIDLQGEVTPVNRVIINKDNYKQVVYYWFEQRGRHITNQYAMKWYLLLDSIQKNRSDGALVRATTLVRPNETVDKAEKRMQSFLGTVVKKLPEYVPN